MVEQWRGAGFQPPGKERIAKIYTGIFAEETIDKV
jgi:hypothetical protein